MKDRSGLYVCPRCGHLRAAIRVVGALRIEFDPTPQRVICPREGADMRPVVSVRA